MLRFSTLFLNTIDTFKKASSSFLFFKVFFPNVIHSTSNKKVILSSLTKFLRYFVSYVFQKHWAKFENSICSIFFWYIDSCSSRTRRIHNKYQSLTCFDYYEFDFFRYRAVVFPFKEKTSKRAVTGVMVLIWFGSSVLALPAYLFSSVWVILAYHKIYVYINWLQEPIFKLYFLFIEFI